MLVKLMKHELKATARLLVPLYLVLLGISIINRFTFQSGAGGGVAGFIKELLMLTQGMFIIVILVVTGIFMITRFYKNLLSDEGYLMFTLPVKVHHLITSKLLITLFWIFVSLAVIIGSGYIVVVTPDGISLIGTVIENALAELNAQFGGNWVLVLAELIMLALLGLVANILLIYVSIALGQLFTKHKVIASFVSYGVLYTALQILMLVVVAIFVYFITGNNIDIINHISPQVIFPIGIVAAFIEGTIFYAATNHIFSRKLNLD